MPAKTDTRSTVLKTVEENPGLHFREIQRRTRCATGQLQYHLYQLEREGIIVRKIDGRVTRYFSNERGTVMERNILFHLRNRESLSIIMKLLSGDMVASELAGKRKDEEALDRLNIMVKEGIVDQRRSGSEIYYSLHDRNSIIDVMKRYRESFLDTLAFNLFSLLK